MKRRYSQNGLTLIELIISVALGIAAVSAIMFFYLSTVVSSSESLKKAKLNQEIMTLMSLMVQDIRRAGVVNTNGLPIIQSPTLPMPNAFENIYNKDGNELLLWHFDGANAIQKTDFESDVGNCVTFSYDIDLDYNYTVSTLAENNELFGYRLNPSKNVVEIRVNGDPNNPDSCDSSNDWEAITDAKSIKVTSLLFDLKSSSCLNHSISYVDANGDGVNDNLANENCLSIGTVPTTDDNISSVRVVKIRISAELANDNEVKIQLSDTVKVRNDRVYEY